MVVAPCTVGSGADKCRHRLIDHVIPVQNLKWDWSGVVGTQIEVTSTEIPHRWRQVWAIWEQNIGCELLADKP